MKKIFIFAAIMLTALMVSANVLVWRNGQIIYQDLNRNRLDSITFEPQTLTDTLSIKTTAFFWRNDTIVNTRQTNLIDSITLFYPKTFKQDVIFSFSAMTEDGKRCILDSVKIQNISQNWQMTLDCNRDTSITFARGDNQLYTNDQLLFTGYSKRGNNIHSKSVPEIVHGSNLITFIFPSIAHYGEGIYAAIIGFNNTLYPYNFTYLTENNISSFHSFIDELTTANGTILYHATYNALNQIKNCIVPNKLENVSLITFTDGLDIGSWRLNSNYPSEQLYLSVVNNTIHRTFIDDVKLDAYAIGVKGGDVTDVDRFENDLRQLASDSTYVYNVSNMEEVNARFREIAAKIYNTRIEYSLTIRLPAPEPGNIIRFTFDNVTNAESSIYYIEGLYDYDFSNGHGLLKNIVYYGLKCDNDSIWESTSDGIFDIFTIKNLCTSLGERVSISTMRQWTYLPLANNWQVNSEFDPSTNSTTSEEKSSAITMLVLDCSSSLGNDFSNMKSAAKSFLDILIGGGNTQKPSVSSATYTLGDLEVTLSANITNTGNLAILDKGFCISESPNMDDASFYSIGADEKKFSYLLTGLDVGKTYYCRPYAENQLGRTYGQISSFVAKEAVIPTLVLSSVTILSANSIKCSATITSDGMAPIVESGFYLSTMSDSIVADTVVVADSVTKNFTAIISGLKMDSVYYIRAYARNRMGIAYDIDASAYKLYMLPTVVTYKASAKLSETSGDKAGLHADAFGSEIISHDFKEGQGVIVFSDIVTSIGNYAFQGCRGLTSVSIPNSVTSIGNYAFAYCSGLTSVEIPNSVTNIGERAFTGCSSLTSVTIPNSVTSIGYGAFEGCTGLTSVYISDISAWCTISFGSSNANPLYCAHNLYLNETLVTDLVLPNSITCIGDFAFFNCTSLTSVTIPNSVTSIGNMVFGGCSVLTSVTLKSDAIVSRSYSSGSTNTISNFFGNQVTKYIIGDNITSIGSYAFFNCTSLTSVTIPYSVASIGNLAFANCSGLTSVHISDIAAWCTISFGDTYANPLDYACNLYLNEVLVTDLVIPNSVTSIRSHAFQNCRSLTSVTIPNSVTSIGSYAFHNCRGLTSITIPNGVTSIENSAFGNCSGLTSIEIPNSVTSIGSGAFSGCTGLTSVVWNAKNCSNSCYFGSQVGSFVFGNEVETIPSSCCHGMNNLTTITIPNSVTSIGDRAFYGCQGLTSVTIGNSVTSIGDYAFSYCTGLTSVTIPNSITSIGNYAFGYCTNLHLKLPERFRNTNVGQSQCKSVTYY